MKITLQIVYYSILTPSIKWGSNLKKHFYLGLLSFSIFSFSADYDFSGYTKYLNKEINKGNYPGFVTLIYQNGEIIFSDTRGFSDIEDQIPLNEDSLFRIYSWQSP